MLRHEDLYDTKDVVDLCQHHGSKSACLCVCALRALFARAHAGAGLRARCGETLAAVGVC